MLNFCDFIQVYVFITNHPLNVTVNFISASRINGVNPKVQELKRLSREVFLSFRVSSGSYKSCLSLKAWG